jgi:hypothetical protein
MRRGGFIPIQLLIIVLVGLVGYFGFQYFLLQKQTPQSELTSIVSATPGPSLEILKTDKNGWVKIIVPSLNNTTYQKFSISHPEGWQLVGETNTEEFTLKKESSSIGMARPSLGGGVCLFSDTDMNQVDTRWKDAPILQEYEEIEIETGYLRRYRLTTSTDQNFHFRICELYKGDEVFEIPLDGGIISITTSPDISQSELKEIDSILATYKYEK